MVPAVGCVFGEWEVRSEWAFAACVLFSDGVGGGEICLHLYI